MPGHRYGKCLSPITTFRAEGPKESQPLSKKTTTPVPRLALAREGQTRKGSRSSLNSFESNTLDALGDRVEVDILGVEGDDVAVRVAHSG